MNANSVTLPPGDYWVGDPCYSVPNGRWIEWLEAADYENQRTLLAAELDGYPVVGVNTAHGDGCYLGSDGFDYPVDAGLIGATAAELTKGEPFGARLVTFTQPFTVERNEGTIKIGWIEIETDYEEEA